MTKDDVLFGYRLRVFDLAGLRPCRAGRLGASHAGHSEALGITPPAGGVRRFSWRRWSVTGDQRGAHDRYVARASGSKRVSWRFYGRRTTTSDGSCS